MRSWRTVRTHVLALAAALSLGGCDRLTGAGHVREAPDTIVFSVLPRKEAADVEAQWRPFIADMQAQTGLKVQPYFAATHAASAEAMRMGRAQAGWFSNSTALEAVRHADGEVFASADPTPDIGFASVLVVRAASPITVDQVLGCGRRFSFGIGEPQSTTGTLAPMAELFAPRGIDPHACFKLVRSANHKANLEAVASGALDVATADTVGLALMRKARPELAGKVRVIWTSPPLPGNPVVWRRDLDPSVKEKLRAFFLGYGREPGPEGERQRRFLADVGFGTFRPDDDSHLLPIREMEAVLAVSQARAAHDLPAERRAAAELARLRRAEAKAHPGAQVSGWPVSGVPAAGQQKRAAP